VKRPVWHFELVRDTNAPYALVREALLDGERYSIWHPRHRSVNPEIIEDGEYLEIVCRFRKFAVLEEAWYRVEPIKGRLLLTYRNRFTGWPVIPLMGWWRVKSERIWERFIASLPSES
jgi:hypothetical protein